MTIYSALNVGVTALQAQSNTINIISQNISNTDTVGYKEGVAYFEDLLANGVPSITTPSGYLPGGVTATDTQLNDVQGAITSTTSPTDIAISGSGFFAVSPTATVSASDIAYTRAGSFTQNSDGNFVNAAGYFLQGWQLDTSGALPAGLNAASVDAATAIAGLTTVNVQKVDAVPVPTSTVSFHANLLSSQAVYAGPPAYDPANGAANMASGAVAPQFIMPVTAIDNTGATHTLNVGVLKTAANSWAIEIYANPATDVTASNGQVASGTVTFNGDGSLASVSPSLTQPVAVTWTAMGTAASSITFNWGTAGAPFGTPGAVAIGRTDGLSQFDSSYNVGNIQQNGVQSGTLTGIAISPDGFVSASYSDGSTRNLYKIPLAGFTDSEQLQTISGDVFTPTAAAGDATYFQPGTGAAGRLDPSALESSNVDLGTQLTNMIIAQSAYQANTKLVSTSDSMLQTLDQMVV